MPELLVDLLKQSNTQVDCFLKLAKLSSGQNLSTTIQELERMTPPGTDLAWHRAWAGENCEYHRLQIYTHAWGN